MISLEGQTGQDLRGLFLLDTAWFSKKSSALIRLQIRALNFYVSFGIDYLVG